ncbi:MAG: SIS domain-containing protein, partial [Deltaproteobacteria bacterium]|nr:SIS domain-containing protein [Deltaproteobacteria bacterium]
AQGRSGNILRCFCMRLMHLGYESYFVGDTITPPVGPGDVAFLLSGTGATRFTVETARIARKHGARTCGIVGTNDSALEKALDTIVMVPGGSRADGTRGEAWSVQPAGSVFEQAAFLLLEAIVLELYRRQGSDTKALLDRHANLE